MVGCREGDLPAFCIQLSAAVRDYFCAMLLPRQNTFRAFRKLFREHLADLYDEGEIDAIYRVCIEERLGLQWSHGLLDKRFSESDINHVSPILEELTTGRPLQYILGYTDFLGCRISVDERVLIPRPETEELCEIILHEHSKDKSLRVLDIGTGSGCIPIALKRHAPNWRVSALDVDEGALALAKLNAAQNSVDITFFPTDILRSGTLPDSYDIVVSNPPYVAEEEKQEILDNVLVHEPHLALFVPDTDTMLFYRKISRLSATHLSPNGKLCFEINGRFGQETLAMMHEAGFTDCRLVTDLSGKERFAIGTIG